MTAPLPRSIPRPFDRESESENGIRGIHLALREGERERKGERWVVGRSYLPLLCICMEKKSKEKKDCQGKAGLTDWLAVLVSGSCIRGIPIHARVRVRVQERRRY